MPAPPSSPRVTLRTLRQWVKQGRPFPMLTCYDATTASWLWRGGVRTLLVGDTAAQFILGHDSTLPAPMPFMVEITAAVRRGAPDAFVMADMPFGSYQCGDDEAVRNAMRFVVEGAADVVKLEVDASFAPLVKRFASSGVPVVAHIGSRPQQVRVRGGYVHAGRTRAEADQIVRTGMQMVDAGAAMLLIEATPAEVSSEIVNRLKERNAGPDAAKNAVPVIGCGAGPACHGQVIVLHDLLGLSSWQPPFAPPMGAVGTSIEEAAAKWARLVESGRYLADTHPYKLE